MKWTQWRNAVNSLNLPGAFEISVLHEEDAQWIATEIGQAYPDIEVGSESRFTSSAFFTGELKERAREGWENYARLHLLIREADRFVFFITLEKNDHARTIASPMAVVAPHYRGHHLAIVGPTLLREIGKAIGAEMAYYFSSLRVPQLQKIAERAGFQLVGIIPAFDRDMVAPATIRRVFEGIYAQILTADLSGILPPPADALIPSSRALWDHLFSGRFELSKKQDAPMSSES